jgi:hypothetical protein
MPWTISLPFYFILGTFAAYKALYEFVFSPFYWHKTEHGVATQKHQGSEVGETLRTS